MISPQISRLHHPPQPSVVTSSAGGFFASASLASNAGSESAISSHLGTGTFASLSRDTAPAPPSMVAGAALFLLGPVYLSPHEWNTDVGITATHMSNGFGLRVNHIDPCCSFWRCGLRQNDCVITANGSSTTDAEPQAALAMLLGPHHGEPLTMHVLRGLPADIPEGTAVEFDVLISRLPKESFGFQCAGVCIGTTDRPVAALAPFAFARTGLPVVNVVGGSAAEAAGLASGDVIVAVNGFRCHGQQPRDILESITNASTDTQCIMRFDSVVFGGSVRREMSVEGQPLTYVVLTLRRRILKEKLSFQISRRKEMSSPSSDLHQLSHSSMSAPVLTGQSPPKHTLPPTQTPHTQTPLPVIQHPQQPQQLPQQQPSTILTTSSPSSHQPQSPAAAIVSIAITPSSGNLGFSAARLAEDVCGAPNLFTRAVGGILVAAVDPSSSAAAAGVAAGDVVTGISGSDISVMSHSDALRVLQSAIVSAKQQAGSSAASACVFLEIVKPYAPPPIHLFAMASAAAPVLQSSSSGVGSSKYAHGARPSIDPQLQYLDSKSRSSMQDVSIAKPQNSEWGFSLAKQIITADMDVSTFSAATYGAVVQSVVPDSPAASRGIVAGTVICKINGVILPCNRGSAAVFEAIKRGLEQGASTPAGVTLTVIQPHSPFPFARSSEVSRSNRGSHRGKSSRPNQREGLAMSTSGMSTFAGSAAVSAFDGEGDDANEHFGDVEMHQVVGGAASISKGRALPSGAVNLTVKVTPLGLGFVPSKILVSSDFDCRAFTHARFGLLVQSVQSGGACEHAGMQQGDVIIGVGSSLLDSTMSYDHCLSLIKSACKKADEDYDDPFIVLTVFHPHGLLPSALTSSTVAVTKGSNGSALSTLSVHQYTVMQNLEAQFTHAIAVARCYQDTTTPVVPGFVPAGAMLPLPRHNSTCEISAETGLPVAFDCAFQSYTYALGGLPVSAVTFGQPAALAGLQKGDVIISVNGTSLRTMDHSKAIHVLNAAFSSNGSHVALDVVRYHSQIESDVNSLLGVKDPHLLSIAITGLGGGAFLPAAGEKSLAGAQGGTHLQASPAPSSVVDSTARCIFFAGLLLPFLLLALICLPRPQSTLPVSVRFWRIAAAIALVVQGGIAVGLYFLLTLVFKVA